MMKTNFRTIVKKSKKDIEVLKEKFVESEYYKTNRFSGGKITPLYDANLNQEGWWLIFDCPKAFSVSAEELVSMEMFFSDCDWMRERFRFINSWVHFDGSCSIWFAFYLNC